MNQLFGPVEETNCESFESKLSAVIKGYYKDEFLQCFHMKYEHKEVIINRGYAARVLGFRKIIENFIKANDQENQIINIGAGFDTTFFNFKKHKMLSNTLFVEVDLKEVTEAKVNVIQKSIMKDMLEDDTQFTELEIFSKDYCLLQCDLSQIAQLEQKLEKAQIKWNVPTLLVSECVLIYLDSHQVEGLLEFFSLKFSKIIFIDYEMLMKCNKFVQVMKNNFKEKGIDLIGEKFYSSIENVDQFFEKNGFTVLQGMTYIDFYNKHLNHNIKKKFLKLLVQRKLNFQMNSKNGT